MFGNLPIICIDEMIEESFNIAYPEINLKNTAYIIYTSGTTGYPKGVEIIYESIDNFISGLCSKIPYQKQECIGFFTDISFDIAFVESIMAVIVGLKIIFADEEEQNNPRLMKKLIIEKDITILQMTPSRMLLLKEIDKDLKLLKNVKIILIGGEVFPLSLLQVLKKNTSARIFNMYGPTETTIWTTIGELTNSNYVNIGAPINNMEIFIINEDLEELPAGCVGEIAIAGKGVSKGYYNQNLLNTKKFACLNKEESKRIYKSGDLGRYNSEGVLEYIGRCDNQIKHRGYRIELEEIESIIDEIHEIENSFVACDKGVLIAIYKSFEEVEDYRIRNYLEKKLPEYMIPSYFFRVADFIYSVSGKINRTETLKKVTEIWNKKLSNSHYAYENEITETIVGIIKEKLHGYSEISIESNLKEVGVDSLSFINIIVAIENKYEFQFDDEKLSFAEFPNVLSLVLYVIEKVKV